MKNKHEHQSTNRSRGPNAQRGRAPVVSGSHHERDLELKHKEAQASGPADESICGEEDPGAALEYLVRSQPDEENHENAAGRRKPSPPNEHSAGNPKPDQRSD